MSNVQQQTATGLAAEDEDSADEYVVIQQEEETDSGKSSTKSVSTAMKTESVPSDAQSLTPSVGTLGALADIGDGLDGDKLSVSAVSPRTAMNESSYSQNIFNSSMFGSFVVEDHLRELVRSENEQNRQVLDSIKNTLGELSKQKSNNNELNDLIIFHKKSLDEALQKLDLSEKLNSEKDAKIVILEEMVHQLSQERDQSTAMVAKSKEEVSNKDEIINVLREELDDQHGMHEARVKVWRERMDSLERMLISQQERAEVNNCG
uniref:ASD2 domain-containing protein n=1 Tax=Globodera pallida TaxID=36090 RepID=A0A183CKZ4_GLOPA